MRFSIIFVALTAALSPVSLAVTIDSDGTITWAPGEECANQCLFKQYDKTPCGFGALSVDGQTCMCKDDTFLQNMDACIQTNCPDQYDSLKPKIEALCRMSRFIHGNLDIPITMGDVCGFHCGFKAFEDARDIDGCTAFGDRACLCASSTYIPGYEKCEREYCGSDADRIMSVVHDYCSPNSSSTLLPNIGSTTPGPLSTAAPSGTVTSPAKSSSTGGTQESQAGDAGVHAAAVSFGAAIITLVTFVGLL